MFGQLSLILSSGHQNVTKIFPAGHFYILLRVELHVGLHHACNTLGGGRVIIAIEIQQVYRWGGGCNFFPGGDHRFLDFDDA